MNNFYIEIVYLGLTLTAIYSATNATLAERMAREDYAIDLDCNPEDVNIVEVSKL